MWYANGLNLNFDSTRPGIEIKTKAVKVTNSHLTVENAKIHDSGNYTCTAASTRPSTIKVYVTKGKSLSLLSSNEIRQAYYGTPRVSTVMCSI